MHVTIYFTDRPMTVNLPKKVTDALESLFRRNNTHQVCTAVLIQPEIQY